ncbi:OsmC family peroxiredoxin [Sphingobacteriales bacterium UPWRP_1]|nr:disulfide bond formation regulator [Sphingobacteriales bacterium TSM_CSM]PSJ75787.1 OsmC family peroxiredoxin [Sphingobacteriales bacterium UPWRP_1]
MQIELNRIDSDFHFEAKGTSGVAVHIDASTEIGGHNAGARPMELLLMGLGSCSALDVILILRKQKLEIEDFKVTVKGHREKDAIPAVFTQIHIHYQLKGSLPPDKVQRAIQLSMDKYCSASAMLAKTAHITHSFEII